MNSDKNKLASIILAAGEGKRIGKTKALIEFEGKSFLEIIVANLKAIGCDPIIVVGGANSKPVKERARNLDVDFAINKNWRSGQFSSVQTGMAAINSQTTEGVLMSLVDHPFVKKETYRKLCDEFFAQPGKIIIPENKNRRGHPIILPRGIIEDILNTPDSYTLRDVIYNYCELVYTTPVEDDGILKDIDTIADLESAC